VFLAALAGAAALRVVVMLGYPPAMWFNDSYSYVYDAVHHILSTERPSGYPFLLALLEPVHSFALVAGVQHLLGLGMGVASYALLRHRGLPGWGATLAAAPVLFDGYQLQVEQQVMSDTIFMAALLAAVVVACWHDAPPWPVLALAGLLTAYATTVRSVGLPLLPMMAVCLLARGGRWRTAWRGASALLVAGLIPIAAYTALYHTQNGTYGMSDSGGVFLYGRVMSFANCAVIKPPPDLARLCDPRPPAARPIAAEYIWSRSDPLYGLERSFHARTIFSPRVDAMAGQFARRAVLAQPGAYLAAVGADLSHSFSWRRAPGFDLKTTVLEHFTDPPPQIPSWGHWPALRAYQPGLAEPSAVQPYASFLHAYQSQVYLRGVLLGAALAIGLGGLVVRRREWGGPGLMPWAVAMVLLLVPAATAGFSYRYLLAVAPFACLAAGLAFARRPVEGLAGSGIRVRGEASRAG
jgi:hypothetical protein